MTYPLGFYQAWVGTTLATPLFYGSMVNASDEDQLNRLEEYTHLFHSATANFQEVNNRKRRDVTNHDPVFAYWNKIVPEGNRRQKEEKIKECKPFCRC